MENPADIQKTVLENGLTILTERMEQVRSVAVGIWHRSGSRVESPEHNGMSHFIEHTVFKGTSRRTARDIAAEMDSVGGHVDAFTSKELVCFNTRVIDEHLPRAFDVLADLVLDPVFPEEELRREQNVILEEIRMDEDNPEYLAQETFSQNFWPGHPLGRPILGTAETVTTFDRARARAFYQEWYRPANLTITAAGKLDHGNFVEMAGSLFSVLTAAENGFQQSAPEPHPALTTRVKEELTQAQLLVGVPCYELTHEKRYAMNLLANILGGGMSSRLFQRVREQEGLVYSVYADLSAYRDAGCLSVSAGTAPDTLPRVLELVCEEITRMKDELVPEDELQRAKDSVRGSVLLSLESTSARMGNLARQQIYFGRILSVEQVLERIEAVSAAEIRELANNFFVAEKASATALGNLPNFSLSRDHITF